MKKAAENHLLIFRRDSGAKVANFDITFFVLMIRTYHNKAFVRGVFNSVFKKSFNDFFKHTAIHIDIFAVLKFSEELYRQSGAAPGDGAAPEGPGAPGAADEGTGTEENVVDADYEVKE